MEDDNAQQQIAYSWIHREAIERIEIAPNRMQKDPWQPSWTSNMKRLNEVAGESVQLEAVACPITGLEDQNQGLREKRIHGRQYNIVSERQAPRSLEYLIGS
jgi:hypothetical protein